MRYRHILGLLAVSAVLRAGTFFIPHTGNDEVIYYLLGKNLLADPTGYTLRELLIPTHDGLSAIVEGRHYLYPEYYASPLFHVAPLFSYLISISFMVSGIDFATAAQIPYIFGVLLPVAVFFLAREMFDEKVGLLSCFMVLICPLCMTSSARIWTESPLTFFVITAIFFFSRGIDRKGYRDIVLGGVFLGLAILIKQSGVLLVPMLVLLWHQKKKQADSRLYLGMGAAFLVVLPWILWVVKIFGNPLYPFHLPAEAFTNSLSDDIWWAIIENTPWYHDILVLPSVAPMYIFSFLALLSPRFLRDKKVQILLMWALPFFLYFNGDELRHKVPAIPAVAMLTSYYLVTTYNEKGPVVKGVLVATVLIFSYMSLVNGLELVFRAHNLLEYNYYVSFLGGFYPEQQQLIDILGAGNG